ncbi:unnamed protein product, partial [Effrenium voratum]
AGSPRSVAARLAPFRSLSEPLMGRVLRLCRLGVLVAVPHPETGTTVGLLPKAARRPRSVEELTLGEELEGIVVRTTQNMTLVDVGVKQRGLLPPSKAAEGHAQVGDRVQVWVSEVRSSKRKRRTTLILAADPNKVFKPESLGPPADLKDFEVGAWYVGRVLRVPFGLGAFVAVEDGSGGVAEGLVRVRVLSVDPAKGWMYLSTRPAHLSREEQLALLENCTEVLDGRVLSVEEQGSWVEVVHPAATVAGFLPNKKVEVNQRVKVQIQDLDAARGKLRLRLWKGGGQDFKALLADELGDDALDMLAEGEDVRVWAEVTDRGLDLSIAG